MTSGARVYLDYTPAQHELRDQLRSYFASVRTPAVRDAMAAEGFVNYENEWWHFSYTVTNPVRFDRVIR